jgi:hypothetical protein
LTIASSRDGGSACTADVKSATTKTNRATARTVEFFKIQPHEFNRQARHLPATSPRVE